jgi:hypothetical protein
MMIEQIFRRDKLMTGHVAPIGGLEYLKRRHHAEDLVVDGRIILEWVLGK